MGHISLPLAVIPTNQNHCFTSHKQLFYSTTVGAYSAIYCTQCPSWPVPLALIDTQEADALINLTPSRKLLVYA